MKTKIQERRGFAYYAIIIGLSIALIFSIFATQGCASSKPRRGCPGSSGFVGY